MNKFILTVDEPSAANPEALASEHPNWQLVRKVANVFELNTVETLETVRNVLPPHFSVREMVYAGVEPLGLSAESLRDAVARRVDDKR